MCQIGSVAQFVGEEHRQWVSVVSEVTDEELLSSRVIISALLCSLDRQDSVRSFCVLLGKDDPVCLFF